MEERYMLFEELLKNEHKEGIAEGKIEERIESIIELLENKGSLPEAVKKRIEGEADLATLKKWFTMATKAQSMDQFIKEIQIGQ